MVMKRTGASWMPADEYGRSLKGFGVNLLVADVAASVEFAAAVLGAETIYADPDFAVLKRGAAEWMLHADHAYADHPLSGFVEGLDGRGAGVELRVYDCDPDEAEASARAAGHIVLAGAADKPHGLREVFILDPDGYCWVPGSAIGP